MSNVNTQKREKKAKNLNVIQVDINNYYVESEEKKVCYKVFLNGEKNTCTCGDYAKKSKTNETFQCKHIIAVFESVNSGNFQTVKSPGNGKPILDERFIVTIEGKDFVIYSGLLDYAHQKGLKSIEVELLQYPTKENNNFAISKATVIARNGDTFVDIGDANPANCNAKVVKHLLRMSSTRAKARALRDFTDIGYTALEELSDFDEVIGEEPKQSKQKTPMKRIPGGKSKTESKEETPEKKTSKKEDKSNGKEEKPKTDEPLMSEAQRRAVFNLSRRRGISVEELGEMVQENYSTNIDELTAKDASQFIRTLQQAS